MGLSTLYRFLAQRTPADLPDPLAAEDPSAAIGARALADPASLARRTVGMFAAMYGAFAGDMALTLMARGGVFLAGGVTQKLLPLLREGEFMDAFNAKLEHADLAHKMPVYVATDPEIGLNGAAGLARMAFCQA
jgi:glucokinase